jgi:hypothetical protein
MLHRPQPDDRKLRKVIYPLTEAIDRVFGHRAQDGARPIGAFYTTNYGAKWQRLGGIWFRHNDEQSIFARVVDPSVVNAFADSILSGDPVTLPDGGVVNWELIPESEAIQLPPPLRG